MGDPGARSYPDDLAAGVDAAVDLVALEAHGLADRAEHVGADQWARTGSVAGGGEMSALDLLREAVRSTAGHLRAAEAARSRG